MYADIFQPVPLDIDVALEWRYRIVYTIIGAWLKAEFLRTAFAPAEDDAIEALPTQGEYLQ